MISDAIESSDLATRPLAGAIAGVAGALLLLVVFSAFQGEEGVNRWLVALGRLVGFAAAEGSLSVARIGLSMHLLIGAVLGALHGASQQRTAVSGVLVVGAFYGFVLWLVSGLVLVRLFNLDLPLLRAWAGLAAVVAYGLTLASWAAFDQWRMSHRPHGAQPVD
jgi:hypothetical protein